MKYHLRNGATSQSFPFLQGARAHAHPLWRAAPEVRRVRVRVRRPQRAQKAHEGAHRGEALQVSQQQLYLLINDRNCIYFATATIHVT